VRTLAALMKCEQMWRLATFDANQLLSIAAGAAVAGASVTSINGAMR
jgi:hypothetical protein